MRDREIEGRMMDGELVREQNGVQGKTIKIESEKKSQLWRESERKMKRRNKKTREIRG